MRKTLILLICLGLTLTGVTAQYSHNFVQSAFPLSPDEVFRLNRINENYTIDFNLKGSCIPDIKHMKGSWFSWKSTHDGEIELLIHPHNINDDIDFVIFEKEINAPTLHEIRCSAAGPVLNKPKRSFNCSGETGVGANNKGTSHEKGCYSNATNFLKSVSVEKNKEYYFHILNFGSTSGFDITLFTSIPTEDNESEIETEHSLTWDIYPNPTSHSLFIDFTKNSKNDDVARFEHLYITNNIGHIILYITGDEFNQGNKTEIPTQALAPGLYHIVLQNGKEVATKKFVKM